VNKIGLGRGGEILKICKKINYDEDVKSKLIVQCVGKVAVHLGYSRVQLKCDGPG